MINNTVSRRGLLGLIGSGFVAGTVGATVPAEAREAITRWNRTTVHVVNQLGDAWPVRSAAEAWDNSSRFNLVTIDEINYSYSMILVRFGSLPSGVLGRCDCQRDGLGRYKRAYVTINERISPSYSYQSRVKLLRHEIGHALGFRHSTLRNVMNQKITSDSSSYLSYWHMDTMRKVYGS